MRAVKSVLEQTYSDIELLIVDDGSTDCTRAVISAIQDPRVKYLYQETNRGACAVRNIGIRAAKGEYIAFQDSDDVWHPDKLEKQLSYLKETQSDLVFCAFNRFREGRNKAKQFPETQVKSGVISYETLLKKNLISTQTILGKRACFLKEPFNEKFPRLQDWELVLRLAKHYRICYDARPLADVYLQGDSISANPQKGLWAIERIIEMHESEIIAHPKAALGIVNEYLHIAHCCKYNPGKKITRLLKRVRRFDLMCFYGKQAVKRLAVNIRTMLKRMHR